MTDSANHRLSALETQLIRAEDELALVAGAGFEPATFGL